METEVIGRRWGTWEELLLGGAVLRHGNHDWNVVAAELQARTLCTFTFTPSVCKSKYEDLQQRYSGSKTLFEELRKKRMAELRQALEVSEDSIGSLETKLETLKADEGDHGHINCVSSQTESPLPFQKSEGIESSSKETSKDGLSAGSFTLETRTSWSSECQIPAAALAEEIETKLEALHSFEQDKVSIIEKLAENAYGRQGGTVKKRRGKRKRKDCSGDVKEGSVGESGLLDSTDAVTVSQFKENSALRKRKVCSRDVKEGSVGESGLLDSSVAVTVSQCKENSASRKRKDFSRDVKEGSVGESVLLDSTDAVTVFQCKENSASRKSRDVSRDVKEGSVGESGLLDSTDAVTVSKCKENSASRKDCTRNVKEGSVGESGLLDSTDAVTVSRCKENSADAVTVSRTKENSNGDCCEVSRSSGSNDQNGGSVKEGIDNLMRVFSSILEHKSASTFRHRLDSQKRGRYKKMIRRHMDFDTLRSRITSLSIMSVKEVFRDVLLLANNALVFYSKNTREHKSAMLLRDFTTKTLRKHFDHDSSSKAASPNLPPKTTMYNPPVKPRSIRHGNRKSPGMAAISENTVTNTSSNAGRTARDTYATLMESLAARKKGFGRPRKVGRKMKNQPSQTPAKGRKRGRTR